MGNTNKMAEASDVSVSENEILAHFQVKFSGLFCCLVQGKEMYVFLFSCRI